MTASIEAILTDIEGTTSSIAFVHEVLFPYARQALPAFVAAHAGEAQVAQLLEDTRAEAGKPELDVDGVIAQLLAWIDEDRKAPPLKALQGLIWVDGYSSGAYQGHVYDDAVAGLRRWRAAGLELSVYSSGSVLAQKLLFGNSVAGDLRPLFTGYYDTTSGHKRQVQSYRNIVQAMGRESGAVLFLSDVVEELDAAAEAGLQTAWLIRDGLLPDEAGHAVHRSFDDILP